MTIGYLAETRGAPRRGGAKGEAMQSDSLIYLPAWVKVSAIVLLTFTLLGAFGIAVQGVLEGRPEGWIVMSMSVVQVCVSGLGLALVIFFSRRAISVENLVRKSDGFLEQDVPAAVARLESLAPGRIGQLAAVRLSVKHAPGSYGAWYDGAIDDVAISFRFGLRMRNMIAVLFAPRDQFETFEAAAAVFQSTIDRAKQMGFEAEIKEEFQERDGRRYVLIYLIQDLEAGFLFDTERRLSLLQQFTLILRSACLAARRSQVSLGFQQD